MFSRASHFKNTYMICFHLAFMPKISQCGSAADKGSRSVCVNRAPSSCQCSHHARTCEQPTWIRYREPLAHKLGRQRAPRCWGQALSSPPCCWLPGHPAAPQAAAMLTRHHLQGPTETRLQGVDGEIMNGAEDSRKIVH